MVSRIMTASSRGFDGRQVVIECDITNGLPGIHIVGMAHKSVDEAKERVKSALINSGLILPRKRITLNLSPAQLVKEGSAFDLAMAISILVVSKQIPAKSVENTCFVGELALDGQIKPVSGMLGHLLQSARSGAEIAIIPSGNSDQASLLNRLTVLPVSDLRELYKHLTDQINLSPVSKLSVIESRPAPEVPEVVGQTMAKQALVVAAAGHHNLLMSGPPGSGKSMLAKTLPYLLPPLTDAEIIETTHISSLSGNKETEVVTERPFRSPHHSSSHVALVGGGNIISPGEITLAHKGVLFLDEMPEFSRQTLEALRQPLEDKLITISRSSGNITFPADSILVGTQNPCPCGWLGSNQKECVCTPAQINNYAKRLSGPILDRIDLQVTVKPVKNSEILAEHKSQWDPRLLKHKIVLARSAQYKRHPTKLNAHLNNSDIKKLIRLSYDARNLLNKAESSMNLSARSYLKVIKVAQTIADMEQSTDVRSAHIAQALQFRFK